MDSISGWGAGSSKVTLEWGCMYKDGRTIAAVFTICQILLHHRSAGGICPCRPHSRTQAAWLYLTAAMTIEAGKREPGEVHVCF